MARKQTGTHTWTFDYSKARITLDGCFEVIRELAGTGKQPLSFKLACWAGITSINTSLKYNGNATRVLARFVRGGLPTTFDQMAASLKGTSFGLQGIHYAGIRAIEEAEQAGTLPATPRDTWTLEEWREWREEMVALPGVGYKVASFIGLLCCPLTCPLVPVDRWVMRRLGLGKGDSVPQTRKPYERVEAIVRDERDRAGHSMLPLGAWHWYKWSEARQSCLLPSGKYAEVASVRPESHTMLSPCDY